MRLTLPLAKRLLAEIAVAVLFVVGVAPWVRAWCFRRPSFASGRGKTLWAVYVEPVLPLFTEVLPCHDWRTDGS